MDDLTPDRLEALLGGFTRCRVLVVGDIMLDVYLRGAASRISPEAPVPVVQVAEEWGAPGGAANVAANVVALGARCDLVGCVGNDTAAEALGKALDERGIGRDGVVATGSRPTSVKTRLLTRHQQVARYDREVAADVGGAVAEALVGAVERLAPEADIVVLEDYDKGTLVPQVIDAAMDLARSHDRPVVVDPKARRFFEYAGATLFKPNRGELESAIRTPVRMEPEWIEATRRRLDCEHLLVTLGDEGMALGMEDGTFLHVPAVARAVFDVSGAGDTVTALVSLALAAGATVREAAVLASHGAGVEVAKPGVATVTPDELRASMAEGRESKAQPNYEARTR